MGPLAFTLFGGGRLRRAADAIHAGVVAAARRPALYGPARAPDTFDGRFEIISACATIAFIRLKDEPGAGRLAQAFADRLFLGLDESLREAGVGDLSVAKHMKALARRVYGRVQAYEAAIRVHDSTALRDALARNVWAGPAPAFAATLAAWLATAHAAFAGRTPADLGAPDAWPAVPSESPAAAGQ